MRLIVKTTSSSFVNATERPHPQGRPCETQRTRSQDSPIHILLLPEVVQESIEWSNRPKNSPTAPYAAQNFMTSAAALKRWSLVRVARVDSIGGDRTGPEESLYKFECKENHPRSNICVGDSHSPWIVGLRRETGTKSYNSLGEVLSPPRYLGYRTHVLIASGPT